MRMSQFTIRELMKLLLVVAAICAVGPSALGRHWTVIAIGSALGMFFAEHFAANSKPREFLALLGFPLVFAAAAATSPLLEAQHEVAIRDFLVMFCTGALLGIAPVAISVVALSILSAIVRRISGVRLLKYDWFHTDGSMQGDQVRTDGTSTSQQQPLSRNPDGDYKSTVERFNGRRWG
jgi:hypothetical protein